MSAMKRGKKEPQGNGGEEAKGVKARLLSPSQVSVVSCVALAGSLWLESMVRALNVHYHFLIQFCFTKAIYASN